MSEAHLEAVLAGSKGFALALFVPVTEKVGIRPRVATDATQALTLVASHPGLVVVEVEGEGSVRSIRELLASRGDLTVVAALPDAMARAEPALAALGVETARWDGSPDAVLGAIGRRLELQPAAPAPGAEPAPALQAPPQEYASAARPSAPNPSMPAAGPAQPFFADLQPADFADTDVDVVTLEDLTLEARDAGPAGFSYVPPPPPPGALAWPAGGLTFADAEAALARGLGGGFSGESRLRTVTEGVMNTLSALEFAVVSGDAVPLDPEPIRRAALMRIRVAAALAERPAPGSAVDHATLSSMLGEIDALLSKVNALSQGAPADLLPSLEAVRNALVKEAIDFSEAAQQIAPAEPVLAEAPGAAPAARRAPAARLLHVSSVPDRQDTRTRNLVIVLVMALLGAGGFHGFRYWERIHRPPPPPLLSGAPARATGGSSTHGSKFLTPKDGKPFTDAEIETFRQREELAGRRVLVLGPTTLVSVPNSIPMPPAAQPAVPPAAAPASPSHPPPGATP